MSDRPPMDPQGVRRELATIEAARRQVRDELSRGRRPWWFVAACAASVGVAVASTGLPRPDATAVMTVVLAGMVMLALVERRLVRVIPHWRLFTARSLGVALGVCGLLAAVAIGSRVLSGSLGVPLPSVVSGALVALTAAAMAHPSLRWLGATLGGVR